MLTFLTTLARRWRVLVTCVVLAVAAASVLTFTAKPSYRATCQLFVAISSSENATDLNQGASFSSQRVKSYPDLVDSPMVLNPVIERLGLDTDADALAGRISATVPVNTVLIDVSGDADDPQDAADLANASSIELAAVVEKLDRASVDQTSPVRVTIVRPAMPPTGPRTPVPFLNLALGLLVGLVVGVAAAGLREALDKTIKGESDVEEVTDRPTLGTVPVNSSISSHPILSGIDADPVWSESYRKLRTNISFVDPDHPPCTLLVTSAVPGEGKSVTAANLAASLAQGGKRTILVEADLRRPSLAKFLGLVPDVGLTTAISGRVDLGDVVQRSGDFDVLTSGPVPPNPSEMLGSHSFARLLDTLRMTYDSVVIDTPPLIAVTDAAVCATAVDAVLVVTKARSTSKQQLRRALASLSAVDARVAGIVVNQTAVSSGGYYRYEYSAAHAASNPTAKV